MCADRLVARRRLVVILYAGLGCWALSILWLSSLTPSELPESAFLLWDKLNHVLAFTVGGWLAATALRVSRPAMPAAWALFTAVVMIAAFGVLDETVQTMTPGRTGGDLRDWIADVIGAVIGALLSLTTHRRICRDGDRLV
ncbi:MAG: VanZ family protein [Mycobacterium sp.]|nr:VanZ family protein [Mycobacterium sp.]